MPLTQWIHPLLDYCKYEPLISLTTLGLTATHFQREERAQARLGVSSRYLYKVRDRIESLARLYEALVENGVIE
jgi:hypothetical protein